MGGPHTRSQGACHTTTSTEPTHTAVGCYTRPGTWLVGGPQTGGCTWSTHQGMVKRPHAERLRQPMIRRGRRLPHPLPALCREGVLALFVPSHASHLPVVACFFMDGGPAHSRKGKKADSGSTTRRASVGLPPEAGLRYSLPLLERGGPVSACPRRESGGRRADGWGHFPWVMAFPWPMAHGGFKARPAIKEARSGLGVAARSCSLWRSPSADARPFALLLACGVIWLNAPGGANLPGARMSCSWRQRAH